MNSPVGEPRAAIEGMPEGVSTSSTAFGKYQLFASLGRGGMADVFLAVARGPMGFNKLAVIKRLRQALADEASFRNMFLDEARLAARLNHPNIVHTYEVGEHNGIYFIAMEYLEGQSLNKVMKEALKRREPLPPALCARIVADALTGLHFAHTLTDYDGTPLNIIHRDVSPHNIFVTYEGHSKLVDFGIAKAALSSTETEVGVLKGKVAYMSPEQAMGGPIDCRADVFPMGIVLWEMLTGQRLMTGESAAQTLHRLMNMPIPRVSQVLGQGRGAVVDPMLDDIVARALEKDPMMRFQSAAEMRDALEVYLSRSAQTPRQDEVGRMMLHLFGKVREEVQRQIQKHMAVITQASSTQELQALNAESLKRMEGSGAHVTGQLLRLGGSGSGSGIVSNYPHAPAHSGAVAAAQPPPSRTGNVALLLVAAGFFVLALAVFLFIFIKSRDPGGVAGGPTPSGQPTATVDPTGTATGPTVVTSGQPTATVATTATATASTPGPTGTVATTGTATAVRPTATVAIKPPPTATTKASTATTTAATTAPPPPPAEENGFLSLDTAPWTRVSANGRVLGTTPLNRVSLPPGTYTLTMENPEKGIKQTATVVIKPGEVTGKRFAY